MKLIVGLGNPGKKYLKSRHNVGFDTIDFFADSLGVTIDKEGFSALYTKTKYFDEDLILLKPQTFMNLSGNSVQAISSYFKIDSKDIFVIHDEMDFEPGKFKIKERGSCGGHNGIRSIIEQLGTEEFNRVRIGIGKPQGDSIDFVLSKPTKEEQLLIDKLKNDVVDALKIAIKEGVQKAMNKYNKQGEETD